MLRIKATHLTQLEKIVALEIDEIYLKSDISYDRGEDMIIGPHSKANVALIPTQDKNRPKADFCPSGFIIFGQQKTCTPIRIFCIHSFKHHIGGGQQQKCRTKSSSL